MQKPTVRKEIHEPTGACQVDSRGLTNWAEAPIVEVTLPTCPQCGDAKYIAIRGWRDPDGGRTSRRVCATCSNRYIVLTLPPDSGVY